MYYVYIIKSVKSNYRYVGFTSELNVRIKEHNDGICKSTMPYRPFTLLAYIAVKDKETAIELERYFKTGSGKAFLAKRIVRDK